jgi:hypothetical protein
MFSNFYLMKNYKNANNSTTGEAWISRNFFMKHPHYADCRGAFVTPMEPKLECPEIMRLYVRLLQKKKL